MLDCACRVQLGYNWRIVVAVHILWSSRSTASNSIIVPGKPQSYMDGQGSGASAWDRLASLLSRRPFVRAAAVAQLASLVLAAVGSCSATLSRQVSAPL